MQILKKICDHPSLLTKRAAEDVLEGMDSMLNQDECGLAEKLAMHAANLTEEDDFQEKHDNLSCKISFILSLLVCGSYKFCDICDVATTYCYLVSNSCEILQNKLIPEGHNVLIFSQTRKMLNLIQVYYSNHNLQSFSVSILQFAISGWVGNGFVCIL